MIEMRKQDWRMMAGLFFVLLIILSSILLYKIQPKAKTSTVQPTFNTVTTKTEYGVRVEYQDENGNPVTPYGNVSMIEKVQDENGNTILEMFYHLGEPTASSTGQYGNSHRYDEAGNQCESTCLDRNGQPMNGLNGYAMVKRTFHEDGSLKDERYYNTLGQSVKANNGEYGFRHENGKVYVLNENGEVTFKWFVFINHYHWLVVVVGGILVILFCFLPKKWTTILLIGYILGILFLTLKRSSESRGLNLDLFWSYQQFWENISIRTQILDNIWLFIPLGAGIFVIFRKPVWLLFPFCLSIIIETTQYCFGLGFCELDDIFSNTLGAAIGFFMALALEKILIELRADGIK